MNRTTETTLGGFAVVVWLVLAIPTAAEAHALGVEAKLKDGKVTIEAFYDDDTPADAAKVVIADPDGKVMTEGKTDKVGKWSFNAPPAGKYKVTVDAGGGHRATITLTIPTASQPPSPTEKAPDTGSVAPSTKPSSEEITVSDGPTRSEFTGWQRFAWAAAGLVVIGGGTWILTRFLRTVKGWPRTEGEA